MSTAWSDLKIGSKIRSLIGSKDVDKNRLDNPDHDNSTITNNESLSASNQASTMASTEDHAPGLPIDDDEDWGPPKTFNSNSSQIGRDDATSPVLSKKKAKRSKHASSPTETRPKLGLDAVEPKDEPQDSPPKKKKRKHGDSNDPSDRKKRKSRHENASETGDTVIRDATPEPSEQQSSRPDQQSPSAARAKRRGPGKSSDLTRGTTAEIESAIREVITEHGETQGKQSSEQTEPKTTAQAIALSALAEEGAQAAAGNEDAEDEQETPEPKRARPTRQKKAKPTYFDQPEEEAYEDGMPLESAVTPKPRRELAAAPKRVPKRQRLKIEREMQDNDNNNDGDEEYVRKRGAAPNKNFRQGKFSEEEMTRISLAIERFRAAHDMEQREVNEMIQAAGGTTAGKLHKELWDTILDEFTDRHRQKIINITRKKFHNFIARAKWSREQDMELADLINTHGLKWSLMAGMINRHPEDLRDRYRNYLICGDKQRKEAWDTEEEKKLTEFIIEAIKGIDEARIEAPTNERLHKEYEDLIDWQTISESMNRTRSRLQCITKWKSMNLRTHSKDKLKSSEPNASINFRLEAARRQIDDLPDEEKVRFLMALNNSSVSTDDKIPWTKLMSKQFRDSFKRASRELLWFRLKQSVPDWQNKSVRDCAQYLVTKYNGDNELVNVTGEGFDDATEMELIRSVPEPKPAVGKSGPSNTEEGGPISDEYVKPDDDDDENDENEIGADVEAYEASATNGNGNAVTPEPEEPQEMQIDPALAEVPVLGKNATPAKRTLTGKRPAGRKPKRPTEAVEDELPTASSRKRKQANRGRPNKMAEKSYDVSSDTPMDDLEDVAA